MSTPVRILSVADSDSYLKWSHALVQQAPANWLTHEVVLGNVIAPSPAQARAATGAEIPRVSIAALVARVRRLRPDAILLACTGPALVTVVEALHLAGLLGPRNPGRPVLVAGFPGITVPANELALQYRESCDLLVVHSRREVVEHRRLIAARDARSDTRDTRDGGRGTGPRVGLARLPFLPTGPADTGIDAGAHRDVVFAAQSLVPATEAQRRAILEALAAVPAELEPVIKVRALAGERQAHNEALPYASLDPDPRIRFRAGSMADALAGAGAFATVSSTAALEAIAMGIPSLVLSDFGVDNSMINKVFEGSGLIGSLADLSAGRFAHPDPNWLAENYFHDPGQDTWARELEELVAGPRPPVEISSAGGRAAVTRVRRWLRLLARPEHGRTLHALRHRRPGG